MAEVGFAPVRVARVSFVGELGWEVYVPVEMAMPVFDRLLKDGQGVGLSLAGLHALDSCRIEKKFLHFGHDIADEDTPLEAGCGFVCAMNKAIPFIGHDAIATQKDTGAHLRKRLVQFVLEDPEPLFYHHEPLWRDDLLCRLSDLRELWSHPWWPRSVWGTSSTMSRSTRPGSMPAAGRSTSAVRCLPRRQACARCTIRRASACGSGRLVAVPALPPVTCAGRSDRVRSGAMAYWLFKSEPDAFSIDDLKSMPKRTDHWDGIRNYQARNFMRDDMCRGDQGFFYHSSCAEPGIVGIVEIVSEAYPDHTALDPESPYHDPKATQDDPRWCMVDVRFKRRFKQTVTLARLREVAELSDMTLLKKGNRLSIMPISEAHWQTIVELVSAR